MPEQQRSTMDEMQEWVARQLGIYFPSDQAPIFRARIESLCSQQGLSPEDAWRKLQNGDAGLTARLAEAVSTNHTSFFREPELFEAFGEKVLPSLPPGEIRIWSAAASTGEEAYSIGIWARCTLGEQASRLRILGTDISERALQRAERGVYPKARIAEVSPEHGLYFTRLNELDVRLVQNVASLCTFRRLNLAQFPWPFQRRFHVIFLRNVLYYFDDALRQRVVQSCFEATEPGGWLVTSLTEPMLDLRLQWKQTRPGLYRKEAW